MEFLTSCAAVGVWPKVSHIKREHNQWADDLTKGLLSSFNPSLRYSPSLDPSFFLLCQPLRQPLLLKLRTANDID